MIGNLLGMFLRISKMAEVDPKTWELKDKRICRQAMIKAAVDFTKDKEINYKEVTTIAEYFVNWVYENTEELPLPTPEQKTILEVFNTKYGIDSATVYKVYGRYPVNKTEAAEALKKIQEN